MAVNTDVTGLNTFYNVTGVLQVSFPTGTIVTNVGGVATTQSTSLGSVPAVNEYVLLTDTTTSNQTLAPISAVSTGATGYTLSIPSSSISNLNINNAWTSQLWDPEVMPQAYVSTNLAPTNARERLYYSTLVTGKYGATLSKVPASGLASNVNAERLSNINANYWNILNNPNAIAVGTANPKLINNFTLVSQPSTAVVTSGGGNTVLTYNTPSSTYYGSFNGSTQYLTFPASQFGFVGNNFTVEAWVRLNALPTSDAWPTNYNLHMVVAECGTPSLGDGCACIIGATKLTFHSNDTQYASTSNHGISVGYWYHLAYIRNGNTLYFYVNGVSIGSVAFSGNVGTGSSGYIGCETGQGAFLNGIISNVRVVNGTAVYTGNFTPQGPLSRIQNARTNVAALTGTETSLLTLQNSTIIDNSSLIAAQPTYITGTTYGGAFDGVTQYLSVPASASFAFGISDFTIECWVYPTGTAPTGASSDSNRWIYGNRNGGSTSPYLTWGTNGLNFSTDTTNPINTTTQLTLNAWQHIAVVRSNGTITMYLNGVSIGSTSTVFNFTDAASAPNIGRSNQGNYFWYGYISNLRIVKGTAVYTNNFIPSGPLTYIPNTVLLTLQTAAIIDNIPPTVGVGNSITNGGSVTTTTFPASGIIVSNNNAVTTTPIANPVPVFTSTNDYVLLTDSVSNNQALAQITATTPTSITVPTSSVANLNTNNIWALQLWDPEVLPQTNVRTLTSTGIARENLFYATTARGRYGSTFTTPNFYTGALQSNYATVTLVNKQLEVIKSPAQVPANYTLSNFDTRYWTYPTNSNKVSVGTANPKLLNYSTASSQLISGSNAVLTFNSPSSNIPYITSGSTYYGSFNGTSGYLTVSDSAALQPGSNNYTVEAWIYQTATGGVNGASIISKANTGSLGPYLLQVNGSQVRALVSTDGGTWAVIITGPSISLNVWYHVALVRSGSTFTLYVNGLSSATGTVSGTVYNAVNYPLMIGNGNYASATFTGFISNVRVVIGAAVYTGNFTPLGPLSYIQPARPNVQALGGTETGLLTLQNSAIVDNSPLIAPQPTYITGTTYGGAFNGFNQYLTNNLATVSNFGTGQFTVECWIYCTNINATTVFYDGRPTNANGAYLTLCTSQTVVGAFQIYISSAFRYTSNLILSNNVWYHIAVVRSGTGTNQTAIYINGTLDGTYTEATSFNNGGNTIGAASFTLGTAAFPGYISNLRIVKGGALYTSNFTPSGPLTTTVSSGTVSLLILQTNPIADVSPSGNTYNNIGNVSATTFPTSANVVGNTGTVTTTQSQALGTIPTVNDYALVTDTVTNNQALAQINNTAIVPSGSSYIIPVPTYSVQFSGSSQYLSASQLAGAITTGPFTIEAWVYPTSLSNTPFVVEDAYWYFGNNGGWYVSINTDGTVSLLSSGATFNTYNGPSITSTGTVSINTWTHIAVVRDNLNNFNIYINGAVAATPVNSAASLNQNSGGTQANYNTKVGCHIADGTFYNGFSGYISNVRIINTVCAYNGPFTPTGPLTNVAGTGFLTCQSATVIDNSTANSGSGWPITNNSATVSSSVIPSFTATVTGTSGTYQLSIPTASVSNLNINNPWAYQLWEADLMPQSNILPNTSPAIARERLYYSTNIPGRYGRYFPSKATSSSITNNVSANTLSNFDSSLWVNPLTNSVVVGQVDLRPINSTIIGIEVGPLYTIIVFTRQSGGLDNIAINSLRLTDRITGKQILIPGSSSVSYQNLSFNVTNTGQTQYTTPGTYSWTVPEGVTSISVVAVGGGGGAISAQNDVSGGGGGALAYGNNIPVLPGQTYTVVVGAGGVGLAGNPSYFKDVNTVYAGGGGQGGIGNQSGTANPGAGGTFNSPYGGGGVGGVGGPGGGYGGGGGGAGGYAGAGGAGGSGDTWAGTNAAVGSGGGGGGSGGHGGGGGGGVGLLGIGADGLTGGILFTTTIGGTGGSGGSSGQQGANGNTPYNGGDGGIYGGGAGGGADGFRPISTGGNGAVRIIWPGNARLFPSILTNTLDPAITTYSVSGYKLTVDNSFIANFTNLLGAYVEFWEADLYKQANVRTNTPPTKPRENLYYAQLTKGTRYGVQIPSQIYNTVTTSLATGNVEKPKYLIGSAATVLFSPISNRLEVINSAYWTNANNTNVVITGQASPKTTILYPVPTAKTVSGSNVLLTFNNAISSINYMTIGATNYGVFNGSTQYLTIPNSTGFNLAGGVWTVECWFYTTGNYSTYRAIIAKRVGNGAASWEGYLAITTGYMGFYNGTIYNSTTTPSANVWHHGAWVYDGTNINIYLDGTNILQTPTTITEQSTATIQIGNIVGNSEYFSGYISNLRVVKGVAVYGSNFTPQGPLSRIQSARTNVAALSGTESILLTLQDTTIIDNGVGYLIPYMGPTSPTYYGSFNGSSQYLTGTGGPSLASDFTIEMWVYGSGTRGSYPILLSRNAAYTAGNQVYISYRHTSSPNTISIHRYAGGGMIFTSSVSISDNTWYHIALVRSGSGTNNCTMYINGSSAGSYTDTSTYDYTSPTIGANPNDGGVGTSTMAFGGYISNLRIVNGGSLYTQTFTPTGPLTTTVSSGTVSLLALQSSSPTTDTAGLVTISNSGAVTTTYTGNIITNVNTVTTLASTSVAGSTPPATNDYLLLTDNSTNNQALAPITSSAISGSGGSTTITTQVQTYSVGFNGSNQYLTIPNNSLFDFGTSTDFTIEAWVYPTTYTPGGGGSSDGSTIFSCYPASGTISGWAFGMGSGGYLSITSYISGTQQLLSATSGQLTLNAWQHVAWTRSGSTYRIYVNGISTTTSGSITQAMNTGGNTIKIGTLQYGGAYYDNWTGYISNFRVTSGSALYTTSTITVPTSPLTVLGTSTLLLTAQNPTIIDNSYNNTIPYMTPSVLTYYGTITNNTQTFSATPTGAFNFSTNDFTIECWAYPTTVGGGVIKRIYSQENSTNSVCFRENLGNTLEAFFRFGNNNVVTLTGSVGLTLNTWQHIALVRFGSSFTLYKNGSIIGTLSNSGAIDVSGATIQITNGGTEPYYGSLSNVRVATKAIYSGTFTPVGPLSKVQNAGTNIASLTGSETILLTLQNSPVVDNSNQGISINNNNSIPLTPSPGFIITNVGSATVSSSITPTFTTTSTVGTVSNTYTLVVPSSNVSNLNLNNSWTAQLWDPEVIPQAKVRTILRPTNPRENLYYASTLSRAIYGTMDLGTAKLFNNTVFVGPNYGLAVKYSTAGQGKGFADPTPGVGSGTSTTPIQFWN